jgi:hypothetical protein
VECRSSDLANWTKHPLAKPWSLQFTLSSARLWLLLWVQFVFLKLVPYCNNIHFGTFCVFFPLVVYWYRVKFWCWCSDVWVALHPYNLCASDFLGCLYIFMGLVQVMPVYSKSGMNSFNFLMHIFKLAHLTLRCTQTDTEVAKEIKYL